MERGRVRAFVASVIGRLNSTSGNEMKDPETTTAKGELELSLAESAELERQRRFSADHIEWLLKTMSRLEDVFGRDSRYCAQVRALRWDFRGSDFLDPYDPAGSLELLHQQAYARSLDVVRGVLRAAIYELDKKGIVAVRRHVAAEQTALVFRIQELVSTRLRKLIRDAPADEREVQERFEDLLNAAGIQFTREAETSAYSSKSYRPDFVVSSAGLAIEIKLCKKTGREKDLVAEINDDILGYGGKWEALLFVVYDVGIIRDVDGFKTDLQRGDGVRVEIVKH